MKKSLRMDRSGRGDGPPGRKKFRRHRQIRGRPQMRIERESLRLGIRGDIRQIALGIAGINDIRADQRHHLRMQETGAQADHAGKDHAQVLQHHPEE